MVELVPFYESNFSGKVSADLIKMGNQLVFEGHLRGDLKSLIIPAKQSAVREYDLWDHTCFELFLKDPEREDYVEFNFAPSGHWNCFYISSYRKNEGEYNRVNKVDIDIEVIHDELKLIAKIDRAELRIFSDEQLYKAISCGFTCVIEDVEKSLNYWAINHLGEKPDFHDQRSFKEYRMESFLVD